MKRNTAVLMVSKQAEKLSKKQVYKIIKEDLQRDISNLDIQPKSIIIHRD